MPRTDGPPWSTCIDDLVRSILDLPNALSGGLGGWHPQLFKIASQAHAVKLNNRDHEGNPIEAEGNNFLVALKMLVNDAAVGSPRVRDWLLCSRLLAPYKDSTKTKIRPIAAAVSSYD